MKDAPSVNNVLTAKETPDGTKRYGFWSPELAKERKEWGKLTLLVSLGQPLTLVHLPPPS
jgi:hypothetical protein